MHRLSLGFPRAFPGLWMAVSASFCPSFHCLFGSVMALCRLVFEWLALLQADQPSYSTAHLPWTSVCIYLPFLVLESCSVTAFHWCWAHFWMWDLSKKQNKIKTGNAAESCKLGGYFSKGVWSRMSPSGGVMPPPSVKPTAKSWNRTP